MNDTMLTFFKTVFVGVVFLLGFVIIEVLPDIIFDDDFKTGLRTGWVFTYVVAGIISLLNAK